MQTDHIALIETTFLVVVRNRDDFAEKFYATLLAEHPQLQPFFAKSDLDALKRKLLLALSTIIKLLYEGDKLRYSLKQLTTMHDEMHIEHQHYILFRDSFINALGSFIGDMWTVETEQAWRAAFDEMIAIMLDN